MQFQGIFAPIPTPFHDDELSLADLQENLPFWDASPLSGLVVGGSNGEFALQSAEERLAVAATVRERLSPAKAVIMNTACESTRETIRLTRAAAGAGVGAALVVNPNYYKSEYSEKVLERYFLDVAEASPLPMMLYNMPRNTGINLSTGLIVRLSRHPNIVGVKDSGGNIVQISEIIAGAAPGFAVFAGSANFLYPTLAVGGVGGTLALADILPEQCCRLYTLFQEGRHAAAQQLQLGLLAINAAVTSRWGIAGLKAAMELLGRYGGPPRRPILPLGEAERAELAHLLDAARAL